MPIYQLKCDQCGIEYEEIQRVFETDNLCRYCGQGNTVRIPSVHGQHCTKEDAGWIRSVLEVVDKDSNKPHVQSFLRDPTRSNYKAWMKGEGIRPLENGERSRPEPISRRDRVEFMAKRRMERNRIEIGR